MKAFALLQEHASIIDWMAIMDSKASRLDIALFSNLRTSEAIRAKMKYNLDHPK